MTWILEKQDCPFCGKQPKGYPHGWYVECPECHIRINGISYENAVERWNTRYEPTCNMTFNVVSGMVECSRCHEMFVAGAYYIDEGIWKHCPNCGSKVVDDD